MKVVKNLVMVILVSTVWIACKKDKDAPAFSIVGKWEGKIGTGAVTPASQFALNIKSGGVIERINGSGTVSATGTWQLNGTDFTATYNYSSGTIVTITGTVDMAQEKITGTWQNQSEQGSFNATKN